MSSVEDLLPLPADREERPATDLSQDAAAPESAWRMLAVAVGWVVLALICVFAAGVVAGIAKAAFQLQSTTGFQLLLISLGTLAVGAVLIPAAIGRGRLIGDGDVRLGLGLTPMARLPIIIALTVVIAAYAALRNYALFKLRPDLFYQFSTASLWIVLFNAFAVVMVAPVTEELFFRGWLWNGLRRRWGTLATAFVTTGFWLLLHLDRGVALTMALLPAGLLIALARQVGNSARASLALHIAYNLVVVVPIILMAVGVLEPNASIVARPPTIPIAPKILEQQNAPAQQPAPAQQNATTSLNSANPPTNLFPRSWLTQPYKPPQTSSANTFASAPNPNAPVVNNIQSFTGSESQIGAMTYVNPDCTSGEVPEVRVVTQPANGKIRMVQNTIPINRPPTNPLARCNGKPVDAMTIFYKSNVNYTGDDTIVLDVDFRHGRIVRYVYNVSVR